MYSRFKNYIPLLVFVLTGIAVFYFIPQLFNASNSGLITLLVGFFGYFVYLKQKNDYKSEAANILINEIRDAETILTSVKLTLPQIIIDSKKRVLPISSWEKYKHLFIKDLDRDQFDLINNFYIQCKQYDLAIDLADPDRQISDKASAIQTKLVDLAYNLVLETSELNKIEIETLSKKYTENKQNILNLVEKEPYIFPPGSATNRVIGVVSSIEFILTSTACNKLKKIALINH